MYKKITTTLVIVLVATLTFGQRIGSTDYYQKRISELPDIIAPIPAKGKTQTGQEKTETIKEGNTFLIKKSTPFSLEQNLRDLILFNPNLDVIFPGALVRKSSVINGSPALINVDRTGIDLWINISHSDSISAKNINPNAGDVNTSINEILKRNNTGFSAGSTFDYSTVYSLEQSLLELELNADWISGSLASNLTKKSNAENSIVIAKFTQPYYTASYSIPQKGNQFIFEKGLSEATCDNLFNKVDPPCYISSVTYGRTILFKLESKSSSTEIQAALNLTQGFIGGKVEGKVAYEALNKLQQLEIMILVKGGNPEEANKVMQTKDFMEYITKNSSPSASSPGVPISFVVKDIKNNSLVQLSKATDFNEYNVHSLKRDIRVTLHNMKIHNDGDGGFEGAGDFVWSIKVNGEVLSETNSEVTLSTGDNYTFNVSKTFTLPYSSSDKLEFEANITEKDGGGSGADDIVPRITQTYWVTDFDGTPTINSSRRPANGSDPDIELFWKLELINTY